MLILGSVVLAVTGGEALYADMGHFGVRPIRLTWTGFVLPALALCYLGQGALVLRDPAASGTPVFRWCLQDCRPICWSRYPAPLP